MKLRLDTVAPRFEALGGDDTNLRARVHGVVGGRYRVDSSTDLQVWEAGGEVRLEGYRPNADVAVPIGAGAKFFRVNTPTP